MNLLLVDSKDGNERDTELDIPDGLWTGGPHPKARIASSSLGTPRKDTLELW